jgi:hypothetical protein
VFNNGKALTGIRANSDTWSLPSPQIDNKQQETPDPQASLKQNDPGCDGSGVTAIRFLANAPTIFAHPAADQQASGIYAVVPDHDDWWIMAVSDRVG